MSGISNVSQSNQTVVLNGRDLTVQQAQNEPLTLKNGSVIQGTVMSVNDTPDGKVVNINVSGNEISAKLREDMDLQAGQTLNFAVKGLSSKAVTIMPLYENTAALQSTIKALTAAGLENTPENVHMVKEMMEAGLPINKESLQEMSKSMNLFPKSDVSTLVEMRSLNIPITENNVKGYESYKNYEHQVVNEIETITEELPKAFNTLIQNGEEAKAMNLYGSVLKLFGQEETIEKTPEAVAENAEAKEVAGEMQNASKAIANEGARGETVLNAGDGGEKTASTVSNVENQEIIVSKELEAKEPLKTDNEQVKNDISGKEQNVDKTLLGNNTSAAGRTVPGDFVDTLKALNVSDKVIEKYVQAAKTGDNSVAQKELLTELSKAYETADLRNNVENAAWKKLFTSDEYNKLLKDNISDQWLLKPDEVENKTNIENLYQRLGNQVKQLAETINNTLGADSKLGQSANNLSNNLDFMNQLNQMFQYVQLPLQMTGQNVHGDLYVYRNKHKRMSEDGSVSAVLHLDMDNLGPIDVYVKMIEKKVTTNFYVADESILDLINDNIHILNERLEKRGYSMNVTMKLHDDEDGQDAAVDEMLDVTKTPIISTASFDARA
jgi:hypothetical protein